MTQQKTPFFPKTKVIFSITLLVIIAIGELALHLNHLATWPAFACMVLFFLVHRDNKQIPHVIIGACFGIVQYPLIVAFMKAFGPVIGAFPAQLIYILVFVFLIVLLMDVLPWVFNSHAFMLFIITAVAAKVPPGPQIAEWVAIQLIGGTALVLGVAAIPKVVQIFMGASASSAQHSSH